MEDMEIEGLSAMPQPGLKGVSNVLASLEKRALAEQAALEAAAAAGSSSPGATVTSTYVPGANKKRRLSNSNGNASASTTSSKPLSTSNAGKTNARSVSSTVAAGTRDGSAAGAAATSDDASNEPKRRKQPTIRIHFEWPKYDPKRLDKIEAKHVPIFQVRDMTIKAGLLLPPEETIVDDASSSGGSDDEDDGEKADASNNDGDENMGASESQKALKAAIDLARRKGGPVLTKRRVRDRDEGYDVTDDFVDDSELAVNEPKQMPKTKLAGYIAVTGEVEIQGELLPDGAGTGRRGRKPGSINKPKVAVNMPDGTIKYMSEAIAEKEKKKQAKASGAANSKAGSASASPAPPASMSHAKKDYSPDAQPGGPLTPGKSQAVASTSRASMSVPPPVSGNGTRVSPIAVDDLEDEEVKTKKGPTFTFDPSPMKNGKRVYDTHEVSSGLTKALAELRKLVAKESFVPKNKFPPGLKQPLVDAAIQAIENNEYDENFFNLMPDIFPYNRFTMHKMIKREVCEPRCTQLEAVISEQSDLLEAEIEKLLPDAKEAYSQALKKWEDAKAAWEAANPDHLNANGNGQRQSLTPVGSDGDASTAKAKDTKDGPPAKPVPKFKFSEHMRMILYQIMTVHHEIYVRRAEKAEVENVEEKLRPSSMNMTKQRYAELVKLWPEGYMTSNQLSRELTAAKKKIEKSMEKAGR